MSYILHKNEIPQQYGGHVIQDYPIESKITQFEIISLVDSSSLMSSNVVKMSGITIDTDDKEGESNSDNAYNTKQPLLYLIGENQKFVLSDLVYPS